MSDEKPNGQTATLSAYAAAAVTSLSDNTQLTALQLASVFRIAAVICEEQHTLTERLYMAATLRNFGRPR